MKQTFLTDEELSRALSSYSNGVHTRAFIDGVESENARIIKLIEADAEGTCTCKWGVHELDSGELVDVQEFTCEPHYYIALINGEQK